MLDDKGDEVRFDEQENIYKRTFNSNCELYRCFCSDLSGFTKTLMLNQHLRSIETS